MNKFLLTQTYMNIRSMLQGTKFSDLELRYVIN